MGRLIVTDDDLVIDRQEWLEKQQARIRRKGRFERLVWIFYIGFLLLSFLLSGYQDIIEHSAKASRPTAQTTHQ
jgi:hypothetical protein